MCWLIYHQKHVYTGYRKFHGLKFQAVAIPNGLIAYLSRPFLAPQNNNSILADLRLLNHKERHTWKEGEEEGNYIYYYVYADSAYGVSWHIMSSYLQASVLTEEEVT